MISKKNFFFTTRKSIDFPLRIESRASRKYFIEALLG